MAKKTHHHHHQSPKWIARSLAEVAAFCGVHRDTVKTWRGMGMPGKEKDYPLDQIVAWLRENVWRGARSVSVGGDRLPLSPEKEERRLLTREQRRMARLQRLEKKRELLPRAQVHHHFARVAERLRRAGEVLGRRFGAEAQTVLEEAIDDATQELRSLSAADE